MPNFNEVLEEIINEIQKGHSAQDVLNDTRKKYLKSISDITGRNTIAYYSGWLQRPDSMDTAINDKDKSGFMLAINKLDKTKGLDLLLHTPGGDIAATESLVDYLYSVFEKDIRVIIPQISMSAGTMIALSSKAIIMGKHSNLGPIDPQLGGLACQAILEEFEEAKQDVQTNPNNALLWQTIIGKYHPTLLLSCKQAIEWSSQMVSKWLNDNMLQNDPSKVKKIIDIFSDHSTQKAHNRHISRKECQDVGLTIEELENDQSLQDAVLTTHHVYMHTFSNLEIVKLIENNIGATYIEQVTMS
ncbi:serine protease [Capnocytophaga canimorsus]|uniref:SDH family Clp fold serine proteinase n=1 Tax=Capnocytophaga canimorsus TaxID=28188 RepID=UPI001ACCBC70|nr:S49 family peptidase [Capnocytophaga canimorsus]GIM57534.1 serine protease [Capnocytophaga canimorsus]